MTDPHIETPIEPSIGELEARAAQRRADGTYPPRIDDALREDFDRRIRAASTHTTALRAAAAGLRAQGPFTVPRYRGTSRLKALYDRLVHRAIGHALADIVRQLEAHRTALDRVLDAVVEEVDPASIDDDAE